MHDTALSHKNISSAEKKGSLDDDQESSLANLSEGWVKGGAAVVLALCITGVLSAPAPGFCMITQLAQTKT